MLGFMPGRMGMDLLQQMKVKEKLKLVGWFEAPQIGF
jgi:dihydrodipicolinate reductase